MSKRRPGKRFIPSFDRLEVRTVPAGNITTTFFDGHLRLEGDDEANEIRIVPAAGGGVTISALDDATTINGEEGPVTINAHVKGLAVALGEGDDVLEIDGLYLTKDLAVNGNAGDDTITIENVFVKYRGFLFGKEGDDELTVDNSNFRRELVLFMGVDDDLLNLTGTKFGEDSVIHGGAGSDEIEAANNRWGEDAQLLSFETKNGSGGGNGNVLAPDANDDTATVASGGSVDIDLADNDEAATGETLDLESIVITEEPANGELTVNDDGTVTYEHDGSATTTDTFEYTIKDEDGRTSNTATVTITITGGGDNTAPVAVNDTATVTEGGTVSIPVSSNDTDSDGTINPASIVIFQNPVNGSVTVNANGSVSYTHNGSETTTDTFQYTIKDDDGTVSNVATVTITITAGNDAPTATNDTAQTTPGGSVTVTVLANDTDSDGTLDPATVTVTTQPTNGTATVNANGSITYTHDNSATTSDTFQYTVKDNTGLTSNAATVTINIGTAPVANNDAATLAEGGNTTINVPANDTDSDGTLNLTTVTITQQPASGTVSVNATTGVVTYTHSGSETTSDSFQYTIKDNQGLVSNAATVTLTITLSNDNPVAVNDTLFVAAGGSTTFNVLGNDSDADGTLDPATVTITVQPTGGTAVVNADGTVTYTRTAQGTAGDSFQYTVKDNTGATSNAATVAVVIDVAPVANDDTATVAEAGNVSINVAANDTDSDGTLNLNSIVITQQPQNGLVVANANGTVSYTHNGSETTSDTFAYTIKDNQGAPSNAATVTITITPVNDNPAAAADTGSADRGGSVTVSVLDNDTDADGTLDPATVTITTQPANGLAVVNANGSITYTHNGTATTSDTFQYTVQDDAGGTSNAATVTLTINATNTAPTANDDNGAVAEGESISVDVASNDTDSDGTVNLASVVITVQPTSGTAVANADGTVTYTHDGSETTTDTFQYTINDDDGATSNVATVTITITPVNDAPTAVADADFVTPFGQVFINLADNDTDVDGTIDLTSIVITQQPAHGQVFVNTDGTVSYVNDDPSFPTDSFQYTIEDNDATVSNAATVTITVNLAPVANDDTASVDQSGTTSISVLDNDTDVDGTLDVTTVSITTLPSRGTAVVNADGTISYTHDGTASPSDSFAYTVRDNNGVVSQPATVNITVNFPNNTPPTANGDALFAPTLGSASVNVLSNDFDVDGTLDVASVVITTPPTSGTATPNADGTVTYTHTGGGGGFDSFSYTVKDNLGTTSNIASVSVFIHDAPTAGDDTFQVTAGSSTILMILANDTATGGATINPTTVVIVQSPAHGTLTLHADGTVTYQHDGTTAELTDTFTYRVKDSHGLESNLATVSITILTEV